MAYVLVSHLSPDHPSELARILSTRTAMPVREAKDGEAVEADHAYVIPAHASLSIADGRLHLAERNTETSHPAVIDGFFESLALDLGARAVGIVLSGTGSDGTAGLRAIKARGGATYAQDPASAAFGSMPQSAVLAGAVSRALPLAEIAGALAAGCPGEDGQEGRNEESDEVDPAEAEALNGIIETLRAQTAVDFQHYSRASLTRRIRRRVNEVRLGDLAAYLGRLREDPDEATALFRAVLVHVTNFFREPETFDALRTSVLPSLLNAAQTSLRSWVVGCSTGEQVYSLAMAVREAQTAAGSELALRVFASDLSESALGTARRGLYGGDIAAHVSAERLDRFFLAAADGFRVTEALREMCVFAHHDVTRDPPFGQLDLVLCTNVLIYLDPVLQRRALDNLHYSLNPDGYLVLGPAETVARAEDLFATVDRGLGIYRRRPGPGRLRTGVGLSSARLGERGSTAPAASATAPAAWSPTELQLAAQVAYLAQYPTASVIVNEELEVLQFQGHTAQFLEAPPGAPTVALLRLAHADLRVPLAGMLRKAKATASSVRRAGLRLGSGAHARRVNLAVLPVSLGPATNLNYLVVFEPDSASEEARARRPAADSDGRDDGKSGLAELEAELVEIREYLETVIAQRDVTHAELQAAYQSSLSINEEYQSTNEELESAKEELQSLNEELTTLNEQLNGRNAELHARTAEMSALLESIDMPIMLLTADARIRAFNSRAAADLGLGTEQIGRDADAAELPIEPAQLRDLVALTLGSQEMQEQELQDEKGRWRALRVWPVSPSTEHPDGATVAIALIDIARLKEEVGVANAAVAYSDAIVQTVLHPLVVLDSRFRMTRANEAFHRAFGTDAASIDGKLLSGIAGGDASRLGAFLERAVQSDFPIRGPELQLEINGIGSRTFQTSAGRIGHIAGVQHLLLGLEDTTIRNQAEAAAIEASRMQVVGQLAGGVAHEINNQMTAVLGFTAYLLRDDGPIGLRRSDLHAITKAAQRAADVTRDLLAFSRRQRLESTVFELNSLVAGAEALLARLLGPDVAIEITLGPDVGSVRADPARLEQVLVNLVMNARDAMQRSGRLRIRTTSVAVTELAEAAPDTAIVPFGTYARLIVEDTGSGMDAATKARIFEPFFTTKPVGEGTGLGLAGVYGTIKQSGGSIWVESEPGAGTTFTIDLPQVVARAPEKPDVPVTAPVGGTETVLVIDDEEAVRTWISRSLREMGYRVLEARNAEEGRRQVEADHLVRLVVSDVMMPSAGGADVRHRLSAPGRAVLFVSGSGHEELVRQGKLQRADDYLQKPFSATALATRIRVLLDRPAPAAH